MPHTAPKPRYCLLSHLPLAACCVAPALSVLTTLPVEAQPAPRPDTVSDVAPPETAAADPAPAPNADADAGMLLNFRDARLQMVLEYLSEEAGLIVINDVELDARINVVNRQPISLDEAIDLLNTLLREVGYTAIRRGRVLRVVSLDRAKLEDVPVRFGNNPAAIGLSDTVITQIIPIRYADADDLASDIESLIDDSTADLSANESSNSLILTDTEANVRRIVEIVANVDQSISTETTIRVFPLVYADARDTARLIEEIFEESRPSEEELLGRAMQQQFGRGRGGGGGEEGGGVQSSNVSASADDRTNRVVVSASPDLMEVIASVIEDLDADASAKESVLVYEVKHLQAADLERTFNELFDDADNPVNRQNAQQQPQNPRAAFAAAAETEVASESLVGQVITVANPETNTLLVLTAERNFDRVRGILDVLDKPVPQVLIRVLIAEVTIDDDLDAGVEWEALDLPNTVDRLFTDFNVAAATQGLNAVFLDVDDFTASVRVLQEIGKLDVLSRPYILASDNQDANISIGQEVPFVTNTRQTDDGNTINTIEYRDIGIILGVTPQINDTEQVTLEISQELSALTGTTVPISENLDAPVIANRTAETTVAILDGQTIVIGGLMQDEYTETIRQVPILGDIPILGNLFKRTILSKSKTELLIFLTPEIVGTPRELEAVTEQVQRDAEAVQNAIRPGVLREHLDRIAEQSRVIEQQTGTQTPVDSFDR